MEVGMSRFPPLPPELAWKIATCADWRTLSVLHKVDNRWRGAALREAQIRRMELVATPKPHLRLPEFGAFCDRYGLLGEGMIYNPWAYKRWDVVETSAFRGGYIIQACQSNICRDAIVERRFRLLECDAIDRGVLIHTWSDGSPHSLLSYAISKGECGARDYRRLLKAGYRPKDALETLEMAITMLARKWSVDLNMPKDVFDLAGVDHEKLFEECRRIVIPSRRIRVIKGLAILGADVDIMESVAKGYMTDVDIMESVPKGYMSPKELKELRSAFARGSERKRKR